MNAKAFNSSNFLNFEVFEYVEIKYVGKFFIGHPNKKKQMFLTSDGSAIL